MKLIDVDATIHALSVASRGDSKDVIRNLVIRLLMALPTVDAEPVRHGKWVQRFIKIGGQDFKHGMQCSVCAEPALDNEGDDYLTDYCPFCGAKMEVEHDSV